jgi:SNF2 family DNA or RNA helicase
MASDPLPCSCFVLLFVFTALCSCRSCAAATEQQAVDRCHRIGQTKQVIVKRFVISGTIEEKILHLQEKKQKLADGALLGHRRRAEQKRVRLQELRELFDLA